MKTAIFLRIASVLTFLHLVGHTIGAVFTAPSHGQEEIAVIRTMQAHKFAFMGSSRAYWDFFYGYGLFLSVNLLLQAILFWQLSNLTKSHAVQVRQIVALFFAGYVCLAIVSWKYFFAAPFVGEIAIAVFLGLAVATTDSRKAA